MFNNKNKIFKIFKYSLKLNKGMIIFLSILFALIFLAMLSFQLLIASSSGSSGSGLSFPTMSHYEITISEITKNSSSIYGGESASFALLVYYLFSVVGFIIVSTSSIYMVNKLFLSELKGKMIIWLMSGVSKNQLLITKFLTIIFVNLIIVFIPIILIIFLSLLGDHNGEDIKRLFLTIFNFIIFIIATTSIYFTLAFYLSSKSTLFFIIAILFLSLSIVFSGIAYVSDYVISSSENPNSMKGTMWEKMARFKYVSYPYLIDNLFVFDYSNKEYLIESKKIDTDYHNQSGTWLLKSPIKHLSAASVILKDITLIIIGFVSSLATYFYIEKKDYKL